MQMQMDGSIKTDKDPFWLVLKCLQLTLLNFHDQPQLSLLTPMPISSPDWIMYSVCEY